MAATAPIGALPSARQAFGGTASSLPAAEDASSAAGAGAGGGAGDPGSIAWGSGELDGDDLQRSRDRLRDNTIKVRAR